VRNSLQELQQTCLAFPEDPRRKAKFPQHGRYQRSMVDDLITMIEEETALHIDARNRRAVGLLQTSIVADLPLASVGNHPPRSETLLHERSFGPVVSEVEAAMS
jgi:hypothetical protein